MMWIGDPPYQAKSLPFPNLEDANNFLSSYGLTLAAPILPSQTIPSIVVLGTGSDSALNNPNTLIIASPPPATGSEEEMISAGLMPAPTLIASGTNLSDTVDVYLPNLSNTTVGDWSSLQGNTSWLDSYWVPLVTLAVILYDTVSCMLLLAMWAKGWINIRLDWLPNRSGNARRGPGAGVNETNDNDDNDSNADRHSFTLPSYFDDMVPLRRQSSISSSNPPDISVTPVAYHRHRDAQPFRENELERAIMLDRLGGEMQRMGMA